MKKNIVFVILAVAILFQGTAYAKLVSGKVAGVDAAANSISIKSTDATGASQDVKISVNPETKYNGVASLAELKEGTEVWVDAEQDAATGSWKATSVKVGGPEAAAAPAAPAAPKM